MKELFNRLEFVCPCCRHRLAESFASDGDKDNTSGKCACPSCGAELTVQSSRQVWEGVEFCSDTIHAVRLPSGEQS